MPWNRTSSALGFRVKLRNLGEVGNLHSAVDHSEVKSDSEIENTMKTPKMQN